MVPSIREPLQMAERMSPFLLPAAQAGNGAGPSAGAARGHLTMNPENHRPMSSKDRVSPLPIGLPPGVTGRVTPTRSPDPDPTLPALPPESAGERPRAESAESAAADLAPSGARALPADAVFKAVNSLYDDDLRPNLGLVRRRLKELYDVLVPITDLRKLIQSLVKAEVLVVQGDPQEPVLTLTARPAGSFIDPMDPHEPYDAGIFQRLQVLMDAVAASDRDRLYKGGRYGMAQQLRSVEMQELQVFSLGQVCHIVQLAIGKRIVGYRKGGALVPYQLSDSCLKNAADAGDASSIDLPVPIKSVAELRAVLLVLWMDPENRQGLPLSLVKDRIEQATKRALSEHALGFAKLSHLFSTAELEGCCELRTDGPFQPTLYPPALVTANGVSKPGKTSGKNDRAPATSESRGAGPPLPPRPAGPGAAGPPPGSLQTSPLGGPLEDPPLSTGLQPPLYCPPCVPPMPPWAPMIVSMPSLAMAMAQMERESSGFACPVPPFGDVPDGLNSLSLGPEANIASPSSDPPMSRVTRAHIESGAGYEGSVLPFGRVPDGFSLGPEAKLAPPSSDPPEPRVPVTWKDLQLEPPPGFIEALLASDDTPPVSFLAAAGAGQAGRVATESGAVSLQKEVEAVGAMLHSLDTAWFAPVN